MRGLALVYSVVRTQASSFFLSWNALSVSRTERKMEYVYRKLSTVSTKGCDIKWY